MTRDKLEQSKPELSDAAGKCLERLFGEVKRRSRVVGVFPNATSALNLCSAVTLRASGEWGLRRYLDMAPLQARNQAGEAAG